MPEENKENKGPMRGIPDDQTPAVERGNKYPEDSARSNKSQESDQSSENKTNQE
ncbi:MAG: hypothetical protein Kow00121_23200 [Elainellaceae cyanobacterium]